MKHFLSLTISAAALIIAGTWKMAAQELPAGFKSGYIITTDGTRQEGLIKESFKSKASFVFQATTGKKVTYGGNGVKEVSIGGTSYISYVNDFFKVISTGEKASLLQKMSDATGKIIYNGTDAAGISSGTEGRINDYFIKTATTQSFTLVTKANFNEVIATAFGDCTAVAESAKSKQLNYQEIEKIIKQYNECK